MIDRLQQAIQLHRKGDLDAAHEIYTDLLKEDAQNADVIYLISLVALQVNQHLDAVNILVHAIKLNNKEPRYLFALGYISQDLGWDEQAENAYQQAIILKQDFSEAFSNMGHLHTGFNRYQDAIRCYQASINLNSKTYSAYLGLAVTLQRMGLTKEAVETLELAIKIQPAVAFVGENTLQTLQRIEKAKPILYQPLITADIPSTTEGIPSAPFIQKQKPLLRIIHQLPISGGATMSKCIAVMPTVNFFNNIHPRNQEVATYGQNVFFQADQWYRLFSEADKKDLLGKSVDYAEGMRIIHERLEKRGKIMVIRCWSHLDFLGTPFINDPKGTLALTEALSEAFEIKEVATLCHPVDNWINLQKVLMMQGKLTFDHYIKGYLAFAEKIQNIPQFQYETFIKNPESEIKKLCEALQIPYDPLFKDRWKFEMRVGLEPGDNPEIIEASKKNTYTNEIVENFEASFDYWPALKLTQYDHVEVTPKVT